MHFQNENSSSQCNDPKKREYLKQQHQLRTMTKTSVPLSADNMIETLLSKKEIFQKKTNVADGGQIQVPLAGAWPPWLSPGREPQIFKSVWNKVALPNGFSDTNKLSLLLMTSRLTTDTLGYIWSLSNVTVPGCLTQQELYVALALVALAQRGYTFVNSSVIRQLKEAPLPVLDVNYDNPSTFQTKPHTNVSIQAMASPATLPSHPSIPQGSIIPSLTPVAEQLPLPPTISTITQNISLLDISHEPLSLIDSSPTKTLAVLSATDLSKDYSEMEPVETTLEFSNFQSVNDDDFDDFKSADVFSSDMNSLTVLDISQNMVEKKSEPFEGTDALFPRCSVKPKIPDLVNTSILTNEPLHDWTLLDKPADNKEKIESNAPYSKNVGNFKLMEDITSTFQFELNKKTDPPLETSLGIQSNEEETSIFHPNFEETPSREPLSLDLHPVKASSFPSPEPNLVSGKIEATDKEPSLLLLPNSSTSQEDKYSALRLLDAGLSPDLDSSNRSADEFGDFLTADESNVVNTKTLKDADDDIQMKCLQACLKQLREAVNIFENIEDTKVLEEVTAHGKGKAYLQEILEVERIGRRIRSTREACDLILEFENLSKTLQPYIEFVKNNHMEEKSGPKCGICLCEQGPAHVKYGINNFHAPCANLFLHLVDPILPIAPVM